MTIVGLDGYISQDVTDQLSLTDALQVMANAKMAGFVAWMVTDDTPRPIPKRTREPLDQGQPDTVRTG